MDVTVEAVGARLRRLGAARPRVLLAVAPGGTAARLAVERYCRVHGWGLAGSPADADLLVECGVPGPDLARHVEAVWRQVPAPRARVRVTGVEDATDTLAEGRVVLLDAALRGEAAPADGGGPVDGRPRGAEPAEAADDAGDRGSDLDTEERDASGEHDAPGEHDEHEASDGGHGHGEGHDHGHGGHEMPAGLGMAGTAPDRDGLTLDVLHVALGPVLPSWPAGLRLDLALQGDVVQSVEVTYLDGGAPSGPSFWDEPWRRARAGAPVVRAEAERRRAAAHLDSAACLLALTGPVRAARRAAVLRDRLLAGDPTATLRPDVARWARGVRRSRTLRWMTAGIGPVDREGRDVVGRLHMWLDAADRALEAAATAGEALLDPAHDVGPPVGPGERHPGGSGSGEAHAGLANALVGMEISSARLLVAGLAPDLDTADVSRTRSGATPAESTHG